VTEAAHPAASDSLVVGWVELREGRWEDARRRFTRALATEESAEGLEGLSWACWWLDDADGVFAAREGAYRLYKERGDAAGAARMAIWLAADQLDFRGGWAVASGWLRSARLACVPRGLHRARRR
jgi:LuxR family maltose regulon positive regulatory protein